MVESATPTITNVGLSAKVTTCLAHVGSDAEFEPIAGKGAVMVEVPLFFGVTE